MLLEYKQKFYIQVSNRFEFPTKLFWWSNYQIFTISGLIQIINALPIIYRSWKLK